MAGSISGIDWASRMPVSGTHTVSAGEDSANTLAIVTGKADATSMIVQIYRSNAIVTSDAAISLASGTLTVASGSTYGVAANDVINWIVF